MNILQRLLAWLLGFKQLVTEIALLVEKQNEDGVWTGAEKLIVATQIFQNVVWVAEPWYLRLIPMAYQVKLITWCINEVIAKIKAMKK